MNYHAGELCVPEPVPAPTDIADVDQQSREQYFKAIFDAADPLVILNDNGRFIEANAAACRLVGRTRHDLLGRTVSETLETPADFAPIWNQFRAEGKYHGERWLVRPDGTRRRIEVMAIANIVTGRHLAVWRDSTDRLLLESELVQTEKYEALARLAGGITHNLANLLNVIFGHTEMLLREIEVTPSAQRHSDSILGATKHAAELAAQLSLFGKEQALTPTVVDMAAFVATLRTAIRTLIPENIDLAIAYTHKPAYVRVDRNQMTQILFTIASYASEQISAGGCIAIEVDASKLDVSREGFCCRIPIGDYIVLRTHIHSKGNSAQHKQISRDFPFPHGEIPLNAPAVHSTVKQNHGFLSVEPTPGHGLAFALYFPRVASQPSACGTLPTNGKRLGGNETILLVEDDTALREATVEYLKSFGYCVVKARDGEEALRVAKSVRCIDAVITDIRMPNMGGKELAQRLCAEYPDLKVIFMSGRVDGQLIQSTASSSAPLILKPFEMRELVRTLRQLLDKKKPVA